MSPRMVQATFEVNPIGSVVAQMTHDDRRVVSVQINSGPYSHESARKLAEALLSAAGWLDSCRLISLDNPEVKA